MTRIESSVGHFALAVACCYALSQTASAQSIGVELHSSITPAAGGMGGVGIARPQDNIAALASNPATLSQYTGTNFTAGGGWIDGEYSLSYTGAALPNLTPYSGESTRPGSLLGNFAITQELDVMGLPVTVGGGLVATAGAGVDFRTYAGSNGTNASVAVLEILGGFGTNLTERLAVGGAFWLGSATFDGPFVGIGGGTLDYAARGSFGLTYDVRDDTTIGTYYWTRQDFTFDDAILLDLGGGAFSGSANVPLGLPRTWGIGIANETLLDGDLLLGVDVLWKQWSDAPLFSAIYEDQWAVKVGAQYTTGPLKWRAGYVWAANPLRRPVAGTVAGVTPPGAVEAVDYLQGQFAIINEHRISGGVGVEDFIPGVDLNVFGGGAFENGQQLGATAVSLATWWIGFGATWHFDGAKPLGG